MDGRNSLKDFKWEPSYKSFHHRLVEDFFIPALMRSILYRRTAGYYSSSVLTVAAAGIAELIKNGGRMELIVGADLSAKDVDAINEGYTTLEEKLKEAISINFDTLEEFIQKDRFKALSWMIAKGLLEIKVAIVMENDEKVAQDQNALFHEKAGIFIDTVGNYITFTGSLNESMRGWKYNEEKIKVFNSWDESTKYAQSDVNEFSELWENRAKKIQVFNFPEAEKQKYIRFSPESPPRRDPITEIEPLDIFGFDLPHIDDFILTQKANFLQIAPKINNSWENLCETITFEPMWHQRIVATLIYQNYPWGFLLADEVGLGKTIEAALGIKWLLLTDQIERILIIVPKNLLRQWQEELKEKFNLEFWIYDGKSFIDYWKNIYVPKTENPWDTVNLIIVSSGLIRRPDRAEILLNAKEWDMVVIDEAHHLRRKPPKRRTDIGSPTLLLKLALDLKYRTRGFLLLTATPIQLKIREVFDLFDLLGLGSKWADFQNFQKYYSELFLPQDEKNWNFLIDMAKDSIKGGRVDVQQYKAYLEGADLSYTDAIARILIEGDNLNCYSDDFCPDFWKELSQALEGLTPLSWYMFRFTRKQLMEYNIPIAEREPKDVPITMIEEEIDLYNNVEEYIKDIYKNLDETKRTIIGFTLAIYRRRLTSSFQAILESLKRRLAALLKWKEGKGLSRIFDDDDIEDEISDTIDEDTGIYVEPEEDSKIKSKDNLSIPLARESLGEEIQYLSKFIERIENFLSSHDESKLKELFSILKKANEEDAKRILIFTQYTDTLDFLKSKLIGNPDYQIVGCFSGRGGELYTKNEINGESIWEGVSKETIKKWFFEETDSFKIMVCTDAASEGLNFHICYWLINYDLPWNPMKVEQRIGRIDRVKQKSSIVKIRNLLYNGTIEGDIYFRLMQRIGLFKTVIGPLEPILQEFFSEIEKEALFNKDRRSFKTQVDQLIDQISSESQKAIEKYDYYIHLIHFRIKWISDVQCKATPSFLQSSFKPIFNDLISRDSSIQLIEQQNDYVKCRMKSIAPLLPQYDDKYLRCKKNSFLQNSGKLEIALSKDAAEQNLQARWFNYGESLFECYLNKWASKASGLPCTLININSSSSKPQIVLLSQYKAVLNSQIEKFLKITCDIPNWEIASIEIFDLMQDLETFCLFLKGNYYSDKKPLIDYLKNNKITADQLKMQINKFTNHDLTNFCSIQPTIFSRPLPTEEKKLESWLKNQQIIVKEQLRTHIIGWLLMEYLYLRRDEDWEILAENIPLGNYFEDTIKRQGSALEFDQELFENTLEDLGIYPYEITLEKDSEIFKELKETYKSDSERNLLRANQGRIRQAIATLLDEWTRIKIFHSKQKRKIEQQLNKLFQLTISGIIIQLNLNIE